MRVRSAALLVALVAQTACVPASAACERVAGGEPGAVVQLRGVRFGNDHVALLFGLRSDGTYGVPEHTVERRGDALLVRLPGARLLYPDGTPSYLGDRSVRPPEGGIERVAITESAGEGVTVTLAAPGAACPRALARRYGLGSTHPAALVSVVLRDGPVVVFDPDHGTPGFPMQVVGLGFTPTAPVTFQSDGRTTWTSRADAKGLLDTTFYVPQAPAGPHRVVIRTAARTVTSWVRVD